METGTETKIAGCYPPIHVTFRPDLSAEEDHLRQILYFGGYMRVMLI